MARQSRNSNSSLEIQLQSRQTTSANMRNFLIFVVALCAVCHAAPAPKEAELDRPSPINPDVPSDPKPAEKVVPLTLPATLEAKHHQKREEAAPAKPHSILTSETLHQSPDIGNPGSLIHEQLQHDPKKQKRESHSKPAEHSHTHDAHDSHDAHGAHATPQAEHGDHKAARHQRDIPVPTEVKTTEKPQDSKDLHSHVPAAPGNEHANGPLRHHPVPVAELFNKTKTQPGDSSSEESKESKESKETKA